MSNTATLRFEGGQTWLQLPAHPPVNLALGPAALAAAHWPQGRPTPLQIEQAIDAVEDAIEAADVHHAERGILCRMADAGAGAGADGEGEGEGEGKGLWPDLFGTRQTLTRDDVEAHFTRMAAQTHTLQGEHAAALLMLRELMHHLGFQVLSR